ncbi:hypothetical protein BCR37DRAFT_386092 [Protomyces lactucae-debilis]|uniref:HIT-type domain-containing protein n=1 Tax=Protomyces lactucae-debilis TaxID=2754530 RepID=A0A1Y2FP52_PROLT|nr:uncharacterized protein BCR37DRAFT_386092 [Protomyces lactucae-debilis]ORY85709.1 hypothetical protein BCR37DRAFT_386092 [Protomyces lactucae-debilis]
MTEQRSQGILQCSALQARVCPLPELVQPGWRREKCERALSSRTLYHSTLCAVYRSCLDVLCMDVVEGDIQPSNEPPTVSCQICETAAGRYKCPACNTLTCSLACSKRHKQEKPCSGQRSRVAFIPRSEFNDASINNDYNFLTAVERDLDNAARASHEDKKNGRPPHIVKQFVQKARDAGEVVVELAPRGMKRNRMNHSHWHGKRQCLIWTLEWQIEGEPQRLVSDRVPETQTLEEILDKVRPTKVDRDTLKSMHMLFETPVKGSTSVWTVLDKTASLAQVLRHRTVQEFPTIHLFKAIPTSFRLEPSFSSVLHSTKSNTSSSQNVTQIFNAPSNTEEIVSNDFIGIDLEEGEIDASREDDKEMSAASTVFGLPKVDLESLDALVPYT